MDYEMQKNIKQKQKKKKAESELIHVSLDVCNLQQDGYKSILR